jgi:hypothetical protein
MSAGKSGKASSTLIYVTDSEGTLTERTINGEYDPKFIDAFGSSQNTVYQHVKFLRDGTPVVKEVNVFTCLS